MSTYRALAKQSSHYLVAQVAGMAAGFISLPILTRLLSKDDFGRLSLILLSVSFFATFARLGIPQSITRHLPEYRERGQDALASYTSSLFLSALASAATTAVCLAVAGWLIRYTPWQGWSVFLVLIGFLLANEVLSTVISELYRAEQRSIVTSALDVITRLGTLAVSLFLFLRVSGTLEYFLAGKVAGQLLILAAFCVPLFYRRRVRLQRIDLTVVKEAMRYGLPLSIATSGGFLIAYGDRYIIQTLLNATQVATYSVPYDLMQTLETALTTPVRMAIVPIVFSMMLKEGMDSAADFLSEIVRGMLLLIVPIIFGVSFLGREIVVLLASDKYADSSVLLPILAPGILAGGINFLLTMGLSFQKRTDLIAYVTLTLGVVNVLLNLLLVPLLGVTGSAWATLLTYAFGLTVSYKLSSRYLKIRFYFRSLANNLAAASCMVVGLWFVGKLLPAGPLALAVEIPLGAVLYGGIMILIEKELCGRISNLLRHRAVAPRLAA